MRVSKEEFVDFVQSRLLTQQISPLDETPIGNPFPTLSKAETVLLFKFLNENYVLVDCQKLKETRKHNKDSIKQCEETLKQEHYDSMTDEQRNAQAYAVFSALEGIYKELLE